MMNAAERNSGARAAHRQIVHRAVHRQFADVAAGEEQRRHHERIRGEGDARGADLHHRLVVQLAQSGIVEGRQEEIAHQLRGQPAAAAVAHHDGLMLRNRHRAGERESRVSIR